MTLILETERLRLRECTHEDAAFILALYNEPTFHEFIGDKGIRTLVDAAGYIENNIAASYRANGYGLYVAELKSDGTPVGVCGLVKRPVFEEPDIGFAFLAPHTRQGYGYESAAAILAWARAKLAHGRILAIVSPGNAKSIGLLGKLGMQFEKTMDMTAGADPVKLFATQRTGGRSCCA